MRLILKTTQTITHLADGNNIDDVINKLQNASLTLFQFFMIIKWKLIETNAISFVALMKKLTIVKKTEHL